ncbi:MAG: hypothetical protein Q4F78_07170 [Bacillota bacterium]|nr:hypothetical protein [Bacillota bacterium]
MLVPFDEKLKDIALKIKDIVYKLGLIADYIVEENTVVLDDTTWYYKKMNSGFVEMKGYRDTIVSSGNFTAWGSLYLCAINSRDFPFTLTKLISSEMKAYATDASLTLMVGTNKTTGDYYPTTSRTGEFSLTRTASVSATRPVRIIYTVAGLWK